jgi:hypothetical protein
VRIVIASFIACVILFSLVPTIDATPIFVIPDDNETLPTPIAFWNNSVSGEHLPLDMCVSNSGITFSVNRELELLSQSLYTRTSLIAWNGNGSVRWVKTSTTLDGYRFQGVTADESYVYATGDYPAGFISGGPFLAKYDYQGIQIWNTTWNLGGEGEDIVVAEDGTIVVSGYTGNITTGCFIIAFDTNGNEVWRKIVQDWQIPSLAQSSNHIFVVTSEHIRKYATDGALIWSTNYSEGNTVCARGDSLYTLNVSFWAHRYSLPFLHEPARITRWDMMNGTPLWTHDIGIYDVNHQLYNSSGRDWAIDQEGSFVLLMDAQQREAWYYLRIPKEGTGFTSNVLLNNEWVVAFVDIDESGVIHIAGHDRHFDIAMALYDPSFLQEPILMGSDLPLVGVVVVGVAIFDISIIYYLKKKHPS